MSDNDRGRELRSEEPHGLERERAATDLGADAEYEREQVSDATERAEPLVSRRWLLAAAAALGGAAAAGYFLMPGGGHGVGGGGMIMQVKPVTDIQTAQLAIKSLALPRPQELDWMKRVEEGDIVIQEFRILASPIGITQRFEVRSDLYRHPYARATQDQTFFLPMTRRAKTFVFQAVLSDPAALMTGEWHTRSGVFPYSLSAGQTMEVPL